jgi:Domain of unknown function (DUF4178)
MTTVTDDSLRNLRSGDRLKYQGVTWRVTDFSTYDDHPYQLEEWCLRSQSGQEYYLLYEVDAAADQVTWYLAAEVLNPQLFDPSTHRDITCLLGEQMPTQATPYPTLQLYQRTYQFESTTAGVYRAEAGRPSDRITWDYWDTAHLWNLAIEWWPPSTLRVYQTRVVYPINFQVVPKTEAEFGTPSAPMPAWATSSFSRNQDQNSRIWQQIVAWGLVIVGFFFMITGI